MSTGIGRIQRNRAAAPVARVAAKTEVVKSEESEFECPIEDEGPSGVAVVDAVGGEERFPGIAEGLTPGYLGSDRRRPVAASAPGTLPAEAGETEFGQRPSLWSQCLDLELARKKLLQTLDGSTPPSPLSQTFRQVVQREDLLRAVPTGQDWELPELRRSGLQECLVLLGWLPQDNHLDELEVMVGQVHDQLADYWACYLGSRYLEGKVRQARTVLKKLWGSRFRDRKLRLRVCAAERNNAGYEWVQGEARLTLSLDHGSYAQLGSLEDQLTATVFGGEACHRRGALDLISMIHEYAHACFDDLWGTPAAAGMQSVSRALSEGFAVLTELVSLDFLTPTCADGHTFSQRRVQRIEWLQQGLDGAAPDERMAYLEGVETFANLYRSGGFESVFDFMACLDPARCNATPRSHEKYQSAIPHPEEIAAVFGRL